jgi:myo-inositol catabolism protein IolC
VEKQFGEKELSDWAGRQLLILAFDHRTSFVERMIGVRNRPLTSEENRRIADYKKVIFDGFKKALKMGVPQEIAGLLVDEEFGANVLKEAKETGFTFAMPVEKSGQDEFDFEYGETYPTHIEKFDPTLVKVLVRYNPEGDTTVNQRQLQKLRSLSGYLQSIRKPFLFELLVPSTSKQLAEVNGSREEYDRETRPKLMVKAIKQIQDARVEPTIWKLEGVEKLSDARAAVKQAQRDGRKAAIITLGRGESKEQVQKWLKVGAKISGIIGFAVGRTIFLEPVVEYKEGKIKKAASINKIAQNYYEFSNLWLSERKR